jgi:AcrR family transcriptional regulator
MPTESIAEKASRTYRSELRQRQAHATRTRVIAAAAELFAADGYARTTLSKIGSAAGVSAETVQAQGSKAALLIRAIEYAAFGVSGEENILNLDVGRKLLAIDDFERAVDYLVEIQTDVHERTARLSLALFGGANAHPELDRYLDDLVASLNRNNERVLGVFRDRGWVRDDVPFGEQAETFTVLCSVETFLRITHRDGWSLAAYRAWLRRMLTESVFRSSQAT